MLRSFLTIITVCLATAAIAQEGSQSLAPDQNPNFNVSRQKYMNIKDSLLTYANNTVQETYKAYDWYEAKLERKAQRRENRRLSGYNNYNSSYYNPYYNNYYNGWNNYGNYNNRWGLWNALRPSIGFRTGNWWFSF